MSDKTSYVLGHGDPEMERLQLQAKLIERVSRRLIREFGFGPGMRVLDVRCGVGDMSMLLTEAVGSSGHVMAFDREQHPVETARERAHKAGLAQIEFVVTSDDALPDRPPFDAVVGRYIFGPHRRINRNRLSGSAATLRCWRTTGRVLWERRPGRTSTDLGKYREHFDILDVALARHDLPDATAAHRAPGTSGQGYRRPPNIVAALDG